MSELEILRKENKFLKKELEQLKDDYERKCRMISAIKCLSSF